ncbi:MAG: histidine kinase [Rubrivivax sp.]|nr:histidine kinase [Rubrivivax sp.]
MNTAVLTIPAAGALTLGAQLWGAWRSLRWIELMCFLLLGLLYGLTDVAAVTQLPADAPRLQAASRHLLSPVFVALVLIPFWLPASRSQAAVPRRLLYLALAALLGAATAMLLLWPLARWLDWPTAADLRRAAKGLPMYVGWHWGQWVGDMLSAFVPALLAFGLLDTYERQLRSARELRQVRLAHIGLAREVMSARLAALQAQVEPEFLFDTLVDIERAYARSGTDAGERIERLIHHLRVALPRLRQPGSTLVAEARLLASWLAVVEDRLGRPLPMHTHWPAALDAAPMPPMLLLPLLQTTLQPALKGRAVGPNEVRLAVDAGVVEAAAAGTVAELRLVITLGPAPALPCPDATLLQTLAARASAMHGAPVTLACTHQDGNEGVQTAFTLTFPARVDAPPPSDNRTPSR